MALLKQYLFLLSTLVILWSSCRKEEQVLKDTSARLEFSKDTILFDTVFTTIGSTTKQLKLYNKYNKKIIISSIKLAKGASSLFRLNVDGIKGPYVNDIEIPANDSLFVFVEVTVDPQNVNSPMVVTDSIIFVTNGNVQDVDLIAWGQDAHYIRPDTYIKGLPPFSIICGSGKNVNWINDKPYVIYGYAVVDSLGNFSIDAGVRVHFHNNGGLWVYKGGSIKVNGTKEFPVTFQGDRLEKDYLGQDYKDVPGQWDRIWLNEGSVDNEFNYAVIKNAFIGIQAETLQKYLGNKLVLNNTIIKNISGAGILARFYVMESSNTIITNCGEHNVAITGGGDYSFKHCTFANYWKSSTRQTSLLLIANWYKKDENTALLGDLKNAYFGNCIVYGDLANEVAFDGKENALFNYKFDHCLLKIDPAVNTEDATHYNNIFKNNDPGFKDVAKGDYHLIPESFAIDKGDPAIAATVPTDIEGTSRTVNPDLGVYEYKP